MASISDVIDYDTAALVAMEIGAKVEKEVFVTIEERLFEPALLMQGSTTEIATAFASALIGVIGIASGMQNWLLVRCRLWERALLLASGLMLIFPGLITDTIGLSSLLIVLFAQRLRKGGSPVAAA